MSFNAWLKKPTASGVSKRLGPPPAHNKPIEPLAPEERSPQFGAAANLAALSAFSAQPTNEPSATKPEVNAPQNQTEASIANRFDSLTTSVTQYNSFGDLPKFTQVLSVGTKAVVPLSAAEQKVAAVLDLGGRSALILSLENNDHTSLAGAIRGKLVAGNYAITLGYASEKLLQEIYLNTSQNQGIRTETEFKTEIRSWLQYAVDNRATDIHIEINGSSGRVRYRVDSSLEDMLTANKGVYGADFLAQCMGTLYNNLAKTGSGNKTQWDPKTPLYCMVPYNDVASHRLNLRFQQVAGGAGPKVILRLLPINENSKTLNFEQLGYAPSQVRLWEQAMSTPSGMVLISGITGSGKSLSLKSFVELTPDSNSLAIYSIEDPIEQPLRGVHQIELQRDLADAEGSSSAYKEVIGALVRGDPDIVIFGEIRDAPSASAVQQNAETGQMSLTTVHAHLLSGIVPRLVNPEIGMSRATLTSPNMLTLLAYQALVPVLCKHCAMETSQFIAVHATRVDHEMLTCLGKMGLSTASLRWKKLGGCAHCQWRGTTGLTVVAEMLLPDEAWLLPIREGHDVEAERIRRLASDGDLTSDNMDGKTVFEHTLLKALRGITDLRQCGRFNSFERFTKAWLKKHGKTLNASLASSAPLSFSVVAAATGETREPINSVVDLNEASS